MRSQKEIHLAERPICGTVIVPGSKSISNRALLLAALRKGETHLHGLLQSDDTEACIEALKVLGISMQQKDDVLVMQSESSFKSPATINCRDAGTVARFLVPILAAKGGDYEVQGSKRMSERPMQPLFDALVAQGVSVTYLGQAGFLPVRLQSQGLKGGAVTVDIQDSSQFVSGLMMAAPFAKTPLQVVAKDLAQKPYVSMTLAMMQNFASPYQIEPDASTASYFFAAAALTAGEVFVPNIKQAMLQGDVRFLTVLEKMGATVEFNEAGVRVRGPKQLKGLHVIDMTGYTDTFMTLAAIAPFADCPTTIQGLAHTRLQESDRVAAMATGLEALGCKVETSKDTITIYPSPLHGGVVDSHNDHRIAMSHALIGLRVKGVVIDNPECVKKTCPYFFELLEALYL